MPAMESIRVHGNNNILDMQDVTRVFGAGDSRVKAVDNVSLAVAEGEILLVMGPSGSGKTTLLLIAGALLRPTSGAVLIAGENIASMPERELSNLRRDKIGFIFQSFNLLSALSAQENVETVLNLAGRQKREAQARAAEILSELGLERRLRFRPDKLSGGEKQRISIARALANDPSLVLADEPTANLDSQRGHEVMELLRDIARKRKKTVVIVSHDQRIRDVADRVVWLEDGRIKELTETIHDPVCGMALERFSAAALSTYEGKTYYFCASGCKKVFDDDPGKYAEAKAI
ncbi:MAG: ATP-binding cassette domain-containing protein [Chloroflexi bacterium]|nr:ATP-binding cassette domain-containing protein [Chloroflexota bacterium]